MPHIYLAFLAPKTSPIKHKSFQLAHLSPPSPHAFQYKKITELSQATLFMFFYILALLPYSYSEQSPIISLLHRFFLKEITFKNAILVSKIEIYLLT
jgi:hypothetical protein